MSFTNIPDPMEATPANLNSRLQEIQDSKIETPASPAQGQRLHFNGTSWVARSEVFNALDFGAAGDNAANDTTPIQAAINAAELAGGGIVSIRRPGTYLLEAQGTNPYEATKKYCLDIGADNVWLYIGPGVVLQLADGQQTDAGGAVDIVVFQDRQNVRIYGGGRITGNTAGQTGWTGGYSQTGVNGAIIQGYTASSVSTGCLDIVIEDLQLDDHFSCPVNVDNNANGARVALRRLYGFNCGEGFQVVETSGVEMIDLRFEDPGNVAVGDGIEVSLCTDFLIDRCTVRTNGAGTAFDIFASKRGVLSNFLIDGWIAGVGMGTNASSVTTDNVVVCNGVIRNVPGVCLDGAEGSVIFSDIEITGHSNVAAVQEGFTGASLPPLIFSNISVRNGTTGACQILGTRKVRFYNCDFSDNVGATADGIAVLLETASDAPDIIIDGGTFTGNGRNGIFFDEQGDATFAPTGLIAGVDASGNTGVGIKGLDGTDVEVLNCLPSDTSLEASVAGFRRLVDPGSTVDALGDGHKNQVLEIAMIAAQRLVKDTSTGGVINLAHSEDWFMDAGDRLWVRYETSADQWFEIARSVAGRGNRYFVVDGWHQENVTASQTNSALSRGPATITQRFNIPKDAYLRGLGVASNEARAGGVLTVTEFLNGVTALETVSLDTSSTTYSRVSFNRLGEPRGAGGFLDLRITTDSSWTPETADIVAWLELEM